MIKEQEARRKQQREEEKRKVEEAAAKGTQITNERHEGEARLLGNENGAAVELVVEKSEERHSQTTTHSSSDVGVSMNGDRSIQDFKEDHNTVSVLKMENSEVSANLEVERRDEQKSDESQGDGKVFGSML